LVEIRTSYDKINQIENIIKDIDTKQLKEEYGFTYIDGYSSFSMDFFQKSDLSGNEVLFLGRTIDSDNSLLKQILKTENRIVGRDYVMPEDQAVIVSKKLIEDLGHNLDSIPYFLNYSYYCGSRMPVPLPVLAVVTDLPGDYDFLVTKFLKDKIDSEVYPLNISKENQQRSFIVFVPEEKNVDDLRNFLRNNKELRSNSKTVDKYLFKQTYQNGFIINCLLEDSVSVDFVKNFINENGSIFKKYNAIRIYNFEADDFKRRVRIIDHFSVFFDDLSKTGEFRDFMLAEHGVIVDLNQVKAKENYAFIQNISNATSWFLIVLSIISICLFISNLLKNHIEKIKINLGTFKAFGLNNISLIITYSFIITVLIIVSQIAGAVISQLIGNSLSKLIIEISGIEPEAGINYFTILNIFSLRVSLFILMISFLVILTVLRQSLTETPGNLIYNRSSKK
ncbi:MAG: ABC transporter permease, partial [Bacteroidota bacterium]|nr:ABC transporter permease [Bacteroidota bacterium]